MIKLLHVDKGIPKAILNKVLSTQRSMAPEKLELSYHITSRLERCDCKHEYSSNELIECVRKLKASPITPFEVEVDCFDTMAIIKKYVVRISFNELKDICVAIRGNKIITAWLNNKSDNHSTIDLSKYDELFI